MFTWVVECSSKNLDWIEEVQAEHEYEAWDKVKATHSNIPEGDFLNIHWAMTIEEFLKCFPDVNIYDLDQLEEIPFDDTSWLQLDDEPV